MIEGLHKIVSEEETIVAISTPLGHGGIGVIRVSGSLSASIAERRFCSRAGATLEHRSAVVGVWTDSAGVRIDEVVVTYFHAPHSYTGEDVLEISAHGNPLVL